MDLSNKYIADFETTGESQQKIDGFTRVWSVCCRRIDDEELVVLSTELKDFMNWLSKDSKQHKTKTVFFHNLKFDGQFIIDFLMKKGFKYIDDDNLDERQFNTLITSTGVWYQIKICFRVFKTRKVQVIIQDSLKKLPFSEEKIAKAFNLGVSKGKIDYQKYRPYPYIMTKQEMDYIKDDTLIMARALKIQFEQGLSKMTIGADALHFYKELITKDKFNFLYPQLDNTIDSDLRQSYKGGWVYLKPEYIDKELTNIISLDENSMYPHKLKEMLLPYGEPVHYIGKYKDKRFPLYIQFINAQFKVKKDHLPTIQLKNNWLFKSTEYVTDSKEIVELALTNIDLELFLEHYDIEFIEYTEGFMFKGTIGSFDEYVNYWYNIKMNSTGALRELAKLMLNSLYGKFGTNPRKINMYPVLNEEEDIIQYKRGKETMEKSLYVPLASFVTAYARKDVISTAQKLYPYFIYSDTDSIKLHNITLEEVQKIIEIDDKKLGAWKNEGIATRGRFLRAKTYILEIDGKLEIKVAGLPKDARNTIKFDDFRFGFETTGKLVQKKVKGGVVLHSTTFKIESA